MDKYIKSYRRKNKLKLAKSNKILYAGITIFLDFLLIGLFCMLCWGNAKLLPLVVVLSFPTLLLTSAIATFTYKFLNGYFDE